LRSPLCCHATATTEIYTLSLHDALPISPTRRGWATRFISGCRRRSDGRGRRGAVEKFCFRRPFLLEEWCPARRRQCSSQRRKLKIGRAHVELQSRENLVCRLLLEKKNKK